jgi:hypothetical protein
MKPYILAAVLISSAPALSAIHCGGFTIQPDRYRTTINGDVVHIVDAQFYGAPRDFSQAAIKLLPDAITTTDRQYRLETQGSNALLELMTRENPPRVLNRERCDAGLTGFYKVRPMPLAAFPALRSTMPVILSTTGLNACQ